VRYLAIDIGAKRSGLAVGDSHSGIVTPVGVFEAEGVDAILAGARRAVTQHEPDEIVLGLPLNMDGSEGPAATAMRRIASALERETGLRVHLQDERLTTFAADQAMARSGRTHGQKKKARDALAAAEILREFLARTPSPRPPPPRAEERE
jgi:putative Holliday junction resolvase